MVSKQIIRRDQFFISGPFAAAARSYDWRVKAARSARLGYEFFATDYRINAQETQRKHNLRHIIAKKVHTDVAGMLAFEVTSSQIGKDPYDVLVWADGKGGKCSCKSYEKGKKFCKHLRLTMETIAARGAVA